LRDYTTKITPPKVMRLASFLFHIFLKSAMLEKHISFLRKLVTFRKFFQKIAQQIENTF